MLGVVLTNGVEGASPDLRSLRVLTQNVCAAIPFGTEAVQRDCCGTMPWRHATAVHREQRRPAATRNDIWSMDLRPMSSLMGGASER